MRVNLLRLKSGREKIFRNERDHQLFVFLQESLYCMSLSSTKEALLIHTKKYAVIRQRVTKYNNFLTFTLGRLSRLYLQGWNFWKVSLHTKNHYKQGLMRRHEKILVLLHTVKLFLHFNIFKQASHDMRLKYISNVHRHHNIISILQPQSTKRRKATREI